MRRKTGILGVLDGLCVTATGVIDSGWLGVGGSFFNSLQLRLGLEQGRGVGQ